MKYLYVLTSTENDSFLEQTFVSILSLKQKTANAFITLLTDKCTEETFFHGRENIRELCDEIIVKDLDRNLSGKVRSRLLKTNMRNLVDGDFLYIDSDTVILDNLSEIENTSADFAGIQDWHCVFSKNIQFHASQKLKSQICTDEKFLLSEVYINSGVLFVRDNQRNRDFFKQWNELYLECLQKHGISQDQPTLAYINYKNDFPIHELDGSWNCQLPNGLKYFRTAKILHYFTSGNTPKTLSQLYKECKKLGFNKDARKMVLENFESCAFDFDVSCVVFGNEYEITRTACYRFLVFLFAKHKRVFNFFENVFSLGRGKGFFFKSRNG